MTKFQQTGMTWLRFAGALSVIPDLIGDLVEVRQSVGE